MLSLLLSVQTTLSVSVSDSVTDARDASSVVNQSVKYIKHHIRASVKPG